MCVFVTALKYENRKWCRSLNESGFLRWMVASHVYGKVGAEQFEMESFGGMELHVRAL
jgi:hypothetical protein